MSEYAEIVIGKLSLCWFRNYLDGEIVRLFFSKNDLVVFRDCKIDGEEVGTFTKYIYRTTVKRAKERLDALGYGINNFEKTFNNKMFQAIDECVQTIEEIINEIKFEILDLDDDGL